MPNNGPSHSVWTRILNCLSLVYKKKERNKTYGKELVKIVVGDDLSLDHKERKMRVV